MTWAFTKKKNTQKNRICQIRNKNATLLTLLMNIIIFLNNFSILGYFLYDGPRFLGKHSFELKGLDGLLTFFVASFKGKENHHY